MPNARRASIALVYQGVNISDDIAPYLTSVSYTDNASGSADDVQIELLDRERQWLGAWKPLKGDKLSFSLQTENWRAPDEQEALHCGTFMVDSLQFSGRPLRASLGAKSVPANTGFTGTQKSATWESVSLYQIALQMCGGAGINLVYETTDIAIATEEQSNQTDQEFLFSLCEKYGLAMKVYNDHLVIFSQRDYEAAAAVLAFTETDCVSWSFEDSLTGVYTASRIAYTDVLTGSTYSYTYGSGEKILEVNEKADSYADAVRIAEAQLFMANRQEVRGSLTLMGNLDLVSALCIDLAGFGAYDGKYYIDRVTHSIGSGFTSTVDIHKASV